MTPILLTGPAIEPVSLDEARAWLKIDTTAEDDVVGALIVSARQMVEAHTRRVLIAQTWRLAYDAWPDDRVLEIPLVPFRSLGAISVYDAAGVAQPLAPSLYTLSATPARARISFGSPLPAPGKPFAGITVDVTAGYGPAASDVPQPLRLAILHLVAHWHANRGDAEQDGDEMPKAVLALLAPYRRRRLA